MRLSIPAIPAARWLGIAAQTVMLARPVLRRLERSLTMAAMVLDVQADGPAAKSGLAKGDTLLAFAGEPVTGVDDLHRLLTADRAGRDTELEVLRAGEPLILSVRPGLDA